MLDLGEITHGHRLAPADRRERRSLRRGEVDVLLAQLPRERDQGQPDPARQHGQVVRRLGRAHIGSPGYVTWQTNSSIPADAPLSVVVPTAHRQRPWGGATLPRWRDRRRPDDARHVARPALAQPDVDERADDRAHHLVAEGVRLDPEPSTHRRRRCRALPSRVDAPDEASVASAMRRRQNEQKSCSPINGSHAEPHRREVERLSTHHAVAARNGDGRGWLRIVYRYRRPSPRSGRRSRVPTTRSSRTAIAGRSSLLTERSSALEVERRDRRRRTPPGPTRARRRRCAPRT